MAAHLADWANLLVRWTHLIAGIAWIGSSFYFIWLDRQLTVPDPSRADVEGELWAVHSGGFYRVEKRLVGPGRMPTLLHWFKWEAMLTGVTGGLLLTVVYYLTDGVYLLKQTSGLTTNQAVAIGVGVLVGGWFVYDALYQSALGRMGWPATVVSGVLLAGVVWLLCARFSGRGAYIHVGALFGSIMVANVWGRILPAQQAMINAVAAGREPNYDLGLQAKRRSVHNSYLTFPVLFIMLSSHYPWTWGHPYNALVLGMLIVAGALARHAMIGTGPWARWAAAPVAAVLGVLVLMTGPTGERADGRTGGRTARFAEVRAVINQRCLPCHSAWPTDRVFTVAPNGVVFDEPAVIRQMAARIRERAVVQQTMPLANQTGVTAEERALLGRWVEQGALLR